MVQPIDLLVVDDDPSIVRAFERLAQERRWSVATAVNGDAALEKLSRRPFAVAVVDMLLPGVSGVDVLHYARRNDLSTEFIMITGAGSVAAAVDAMKSGAYDYLTKPFDDLERVAVLIEKARERYQLMQRVRQLERRDAGEYAFEGIVGKSLPMQEVFSAIQMIAPTTSTVMIHGESGTGKELVAQAIHRLSPRAQKPFVVINCAAIPAQLLESELFGHRKGAFTGAVADRVGLFEEGNGGTVFLDEIGEVPLALQVKLLRVLQEGEVRAVGDTQSKKVDVRLIAATNRDLKELVRENRFREDLFYRLQVIGIELPALRNRISDVPLLAYHFLERSSAKTRKSVQHIAVDAMEALQQYAWPGNVRELEHAIERAVVLSTSDTIVPQDLPPQVLGAAYYVPGEEHVVVENFEQLNYQDAKQRALTSFNRTYIGSLLRAAGGNVSVAADRAGMDRSNFKKLIRKYRIDISQYRGRLGSDVDDME